MTDFTRFNEKRGKNIPKGNLKRVDRNTLKPINPRDLVVDNYYLLYNNKTFSKTKAKYVEVEEISNSYDEDAVDQYHYMFEDGYSTVIIEGGEDFQEDREESEDEEEFLPPGPYSKELTFEIGYSVFMPMTGDIISKKNSKILDADSLKTVTKFLGGKKIRRKSINKMSSKRKSKLGRTRRRNKRTKLTKKRNLHP
jgi:hypothetical protein